MGSEAFILYRRTKNEMPAHASEILETEMEGIEIHYLTQPIKILEIDGRVAGVECIKMELGEPDASGRRRPVPIDGSEFTIDIDCIMPAIGQEPDLRFFKDIDLNFTKKGTIVADENTYETNIPGVFAAGDAVSGPATVVSAVGAGKKAALAMDAFLKGEKFIAEPEVGDVVSFEDLGLEEDFVTKQRADLPDLPVQERKANFNEVVGGLEQEQAEAEAKRCLNCGGCSGCYRCITACEPNSIDFSHVEEDIDLKVSSVLVMPGFDQIDPETRGEYGYRTHANVVTALEFERILSASGPFSGHIKRISDGVEPKKMAFIQCVGSRDRNRGMGYCSAVCCMYAIKEAIIAKEHTPDLDVTIFHMDIRAFGKEFDYYYERAQNMGIKFNRCRVADIGEEEKGVLTVNFVDEGGEPAHEQFDMVVLSNGIAPPEEAEKLGKALGIKLDSYGFCETSTFHPLETDRPGVFVAGTFSEPKDIPDTVAQASGAVAKASAMISSEGLRLTHAEEFPTERDVAEEEPRIGVFVCHCGINIGKTVDVPGVVEYAKTLQDVAYVEENLYTCSHDTQELIKEKIMEHNLNRVIVASCSPRTHEPLFQHTVREAELNPYLFEMANIRDQCSWVHMNEPLLATDKAKDLVRMAVANARLLKPLHKSRIPVIQAGLIIGGGLSGMTAALELAAQGYEAHLVEREPDLGGNLRNLSFTIQGEDVKEHMEELISAVESSEKIHVYKQAEVSDIEGHIGDFKVTINMGGEDLDVNVGTVIVATGGVEYKPEEYLYGTHENVMTQMEFEQKLAAGEIEPNNVLMIQCVGSRNKVRPYCSRVCCTHAVKNALKMKDKNPDVDVHVLFKDMRTYGFREEYYSDASEKGVKFYRYDDENKPVADTAEDGGLRVVLKEPVLGEQLVFKPDILVLSAAILPQPDNEKLSKLLKAQLSRDRFFLEAHMKLRPIDFSTEGMFLCGLAHSPKFINESISQAAGTVARACTILSKDHLDVGGVVSEVDTVKCAACLTCVYVCPYNVPEVGPSGAATIDVAECQGCGICAAECPAKAIQLRHYTDKQILAKCEALFEEGA
jgi:heterodisulfide reductase subunit A-like polyferredoxin